MAGVQAQNSVSSPFSRFGYGVLENTGSARSLGMGRVGVGMRSALYINTINPASYTSIDSLSHIYDFGISGRFSKFKEGDNSSSTNDINFQYVSMAFPVTKWMGVVTSIQPVSFVGYEMSNSSYVDFTDVPYQELYTGKGGLSKILLGVGIEPVENFSFGVNVNYIFGPIDFNRSLVFPNNSDYYGFYNITSTSVYGFQFALGAQYDIKFADKRSITIGATFEPSVKLSGKISESEVGVVSYSGSDGSSVSKSYYTTNSEDQKIDIDYPQAFSVGVAYKKGYNWCVGADFYAQQWSNVGMNDALASTNLSDRYNIGVGGEYQPDFTSRSYLKRINYRLGGHYGVTYMRDFNDDVLDLGINFGVGLPLRYTKTTFNIGVELGQIGALQNSSIKEQYAKLIFSCTLHDVWFFKRQFE